MAVPLVFLAASNIVPKPVAWEASILGLVGAGGIGAPLIFALRAYKWDEVGSILIGLVIVILLIEFLSNVLRNKLVRG